MNRAELNRINRDSFTNCVSFMKEKAIKENLVTYMTLSSDQLIKIHEMGYTTVKEDYPHGNIFPNDDFWQTYKILWD